MVRQRALPLYRCCQSRNHAQRLSPAAGLTHLSERLDGLLALSPVRSSSTVAGGVSPARAGIDLSLPTPTATVEGGENLRTPKARPL
jgi:hypothetical protein